MTSPGSALANSEQVKGIKRAAFSSYVWGNPFPEMRCDVHGPLHGLVQPCVEVLRGEDPAGEQRHVKNRWGLAIPAQDSSSLKVEMRKKELLYVSVVESQS